MTWEEPGKIQVWTLLADDQLPTRVNHLQLWGIYSGIYEFSLNPLTSPPLQNPLVGWIPPGRNMAAKTYWRYKGGALFCFGANDCFWKGPDAKPAVQMPGYKQTRKSQMAGLFLNGRPWIIGGRDDDQNLLFTSEVFEPWGEWVPGPNLPRHMVIYSSMGCIADIGQGRVFVSGYTGGDSARIYNSVSKEWTVASYVYVPGNSSTQMFNNPCTLITRQSDGRKFLVAAGGTGGGKTKSTSYFYDIEDDTWSSGKPGQLDKIYPTSHSFRDDQFLIGTKPCVGDSYYLRRQPTGPPLPVGRNGGIMLNREDGMDGVYLIGGSESTTLRLRDDLTAWEEVPDMDLGRKSYYPVAIVHR